MIIFEAHRKKIKIEIPKTNHILLNSNNSYVAGNITRGTKKKRA